MDDSLPVDRPLADEIRDLNRGLVEIANLHIEHGKLEPTVKRRLSGHRDRISPSANVSPGSGSYPGYIEELIGFLTANCSDEDANYRVDRLWGALGAAFYIGQVDGDVSNVDAAAPARKVKATKDTPRMQADRSFIAEFLGPDRIRNLGEVTARKLIGSLNAAAEKQGFPKFSQTRLHERLTEMKCVQD